MTCPPSATSWPRWRGPGRSSLAAMALADLQRALAAGLTGRGPGPEGMDPEALERARRGLESKRRRAASHLLPQLRGVLGPRWKDRFAEHARRYTPSGLLYHVDDAWELARVA